MDTMNIPGIEGFFIIASHNIAINYYDNRYFVTVYHTVTKRMNTKEYDIMGEALETMALLAKSETMREEFLNA